MSLQEGSSNSSSQQTYKIKRIKFFGRDVPIFMQNLNGPCPLLAIANILSLRNQLEVPSNVTNLSQNRLITMVADYILETNNQDEANLRQNVSDSLEVLSKLCTGIDVNLRFHTITGFEPTKETTVFDLLGINLVHGWIVDPQDHETASVLGTKSYNELVEVLISTMDQEQVSRLESNTSLTIRRHSSATSAVVGGMRTPSQASASFNGPVPVPASPTASVAATQATPSVQGTPTKALDQLLDDLIAPLEGATINSPLPTQDPQAAAAAAATAAAAAEAAAAAAAGALEQVPPPASLAPAPASAPADEASTSGALPSTPAPASTPTPTLAAPLTPDQQARRAFESLVIKDFLEGNCSQLTVYGLAQLFERLDENQLVVFFRNNHFNTMFKHERMLFLLVTDQGYLSEAQVVWERLDAVDGDTQLCGTDFKPYVAPKPAAAAELPVLPEGHGLSAEDAAAIAAAVAAPPPSAQADADMAYALHLQEQEEYAARERERQLREQQQQAAQQAPPGAGQGAAAGAPAQQQQVVSEQQRRLLQQQQAAYQQYQQPQQGAREAGQQQAGRQAAPRAQARPQAAPPQRRQQQEEESKCSVM